MFRVALGPVLLLSLASTAAAAQAIEPQTLAPGARLMIERAMAAGDADAVEIVTRLARETNPSAGGEIDALMAEWRLRSAAAEAPKEQAPQQASAEAGFLDNWKGQLEVGASRSTGRTSYVGAVGSVTLEQDGPRWRNKINGRLEVQKGRNVTDVERVVASWQPNYKFDEGLYAYGLAQIEVDSSQDYRRRYTAGGGFGYGILSTDSAKLDLEGGPAFRHARQTVGEPRSSLAARASVNFKWAITPTLELKQASALFLEPGNRNATTMTSFDAQVLGPLKARFSYDVRYEDQPSQSGRHLDTLSRATLVYSF